MDVSSDIFYLFLLGGGEGGVRGAKVGRRWAQAHFRPTTGPIGRSSVRAAWMGMRQWPKSRDSHRTPTFSLAMQKSVFASDAKTHSLDLKSQENARKNACEKRLRCWAAMRKIGVFFKIERCERPAIRTPAAVWPAMRAPTMPNC